MIGNIDQKLHPLFLPQLEALGMAPEARRCGIVSHLEPARGQGGVWIAGLGGDCLVTVLDLTVSDAADLTSESAGYFCVGVMSRSSLETMPVSVPDQGERSLIAYRQAPGRFPYELQPGSAYYSRSLCFTSSFFSRFLREQVGNDAALLERLADPVVNDPPPQLGHMLDRLTLQAADRPATGCHLAALMAETLALVVENAEAVLAAETTRGSHAARSLAAQACAVMERNLEKPLTIASVARELCVSRAHLAALFKEEMGHGVAEHLRRLRLARARDLLAGTDESLGTISRAVGYPRQSTFTETFKREHHCTPTAWRDAHKG